MWHIGSYLYTSRWYFSTSVVRRTSKLRKNRVKQRSIWINFLFSLWHGTMYFTRMKKMITLSRHLFCLSKVFFSNEFDWSVLNEIGEIGAFLIRPSSPANVSCTHQYVLFIWLNHIPNRLIFFRHWVFTHSKE